LSPKFESFTRRVLCLLAVLPLFVLAVVPTLAQPAPPTVVRSVGYLNGTPLTAHTSTAFNSVGSSTMVAFVSSHPSWNGLPVNISGLTDSLGNNWHLLTGPTQYSGNTFTLLSAIYYVNSPATSATHTVTAQLSNPAPLVLHVFSVSGSDVNGPPIFSPITDPGAGGPSSSVISASITVPMDSLLLGWAKNETSATATALNGYTLDSQSTSFLWAETQTAFSAGSYAGDFQYDSAIGWQTAIVALTPPSTGPVAFSQSVTTEHDTPVDITLTATSPQGFPLTYSVLTTPTNGTLSGSAPNLAYTPNAGYIGPDSFTFRVNDGTTNSNTATVSIIVRGLAPVISSSRGYINGNPLTAHTTTAFNSLGASTLVAFVSTHPSWNGLPVSINGVSDNLGNTWKVLTGPTTWAGNTFTLLSAIYYVNSPTTSATHTVTAQLTNAAPLVLHVFAVSGSDVTGPPIFSAITNPAGPSSSVTSAPITVPVDSLLLSWAKNETSASATALNGYTLDTESTSFLWGESKTPISAGSFTGNFQYDSAIGWQTAIVGVKPRIPPPPTPVITSTPANPTNQTSASFSFTDTQAGVSLVCQLDGSAFSSCTSPASYSGLGDGGHTFAVKAQDGAGNQSGAASFSWTIDTAPPPTPTITSTPANPTSQTSASFNFTDTQAGVSFLCQLDSGAFSACSSPASYPGPLTTGNHTFAVKAQDAAGNQSSPASFSWTIGLAPGVSSVSPNNGLTTGGTGVTITGANFGAGATVTFGGTAATNVVVVNSTSITATTPAHAAGAVTVTVTVNSQSGSLTNGFTYNAPTAVSFAQVAAATPQVPTQVVTVKYPGAQTAGDLNVVVVGWNDTTSTVQSVKDSALNSYSLAIGPTTGSGLRQSIYYAASIVGGSNTVTVTFNQAAVYPDIRILEYRGVSTLDVTAGAIGNSATASSGAATTTVANELIFGANTVATSNSGAGSGFTSRIITSPDSDLAEDKVVTTTGSNSATATLGASGPWVMQMVTFSGVSTPAPTVSNVSPNNGPAAGGTSVTITGTNFASGATVTFGGAAATNVSVTNSTTMTAKTPAGSGGAVTVTVTFNGRSGSLANGFTYTAVPAVSSVSPNGGPTGGGTAVTITGANFAAGASVTFGNTAATNVNVTNSTTITAITPAGSAGAVTVTVAVNGQSGSLANGFTYTTAPVVSSVSPNNGPIAGGTGVTITGTNFTAGATVTFGGTAATNVVVVNSTSITATTPAHAAGAVTVTVTVGGQSGNLTNGFTYNAPATASFAQVAAATPQVPTQVVTVTYPGAQAIGNLNVVVVGWNDTISTVQSVKDSAGNNYNLAIGPTTGTGLRQSIYYAASIVGGSNTVTVTFNQAAAYPDIRILEYRGVSTLDVTAGASGNSGTANSGAATTTAANELIFGADTVATASKAGTGFTSRIITSPDSDLAEDKVVTAAGSNSATASVTSAGPWVMQMVTFK
jgi:hypothetical protein